MCKFHKREHIEPEHYFCDTLQNIPYLSRYFPKQAWVPIHKQGEHSTNNMMWQ